MVIEMVALSLTVFSGIPLIGPAFLLPEPSPLIIDQSLQTIVHVPVFAKPNPTVIPIKLTVNTTQPQVISPAITDAVPETAIPTSHLDPAPTNTLAPDPVFTPTPSASATATPKPTVKPTLTPNPTAKPTTTPLPKPIQPPKVSAPTGLEAWFSKYADQYKVDKELLKRIAQCESGMRSNAENGLYVGMYQFAPGSWQSVRQAMGFDGQLVLRSNSEEAIRTAAYMLAHGQQNAWPNCH